MIGIIPNDQFHFLRWNVNIQFIFLGKLFHFWTERVHFIFGNSIVYSKKLQSKWSELVRRIPTLIIFLPSQQIFVRIFDFLNIDLRLGDIQQNLVLCTIGKYVAVQRVVYTYPVRIIDIFVNRDLASWKILEGKNAKFMLKLEYEYKYETEMIPDRNE